MIASISPGGGSVAWVALAESRIASWQPALGRALGAFPRAHRGGDRVAQPDHPLRAARQPPGVAVVCRALSPLPTANPAEPAAGRSGPAERDRALHRGLASRVREGA